MVKRIREAHIRNRSADYGLALLLVASAAITTAYFNGSYGLSARGSATIVVWWALALGVGFGVWPLERPTRAMMAAGVLLAALAVWTLVSMGWAWNQANAFSDFERDALYLGVFLVAALAARPRTVAAWLDGLALAIVVVALVALVSRFFPGTFSDRGFTRFLPSSATRLSFPIGYWNGLGILVALALPLLLRAAAATKRAAVRGVAVAPFPAILAVIYLTSSRGAVVMAALGVVITVALSSDRLLTGVLAGTGISCGIGAVAVLLTHSEAKLATRAVRSDDHMTALLILLACVGCSAAAAGASRIVGGRRLPSAFTKVAVVAAALAVLAGIVASHPVARFNAFKAPPAPSAYAPGNLIPGHLLSGNGSGRWQVWASAVDEWRTSRVTGRGAGTYEAWWAEHGTTPYYVKNAHSLYLETLGELGLVGFVLVVGTILAVLACGITRYRRTFDEQQQLTIGALIAVCFAWTVAAAIDWIWQLPAVTIVAMVGFGLLTGPATCAPTCLAVRSHVSRIAFAIVALAVVVSQAFPVLSDSEIRRSQAAAARGDAAAAVRFAGHAIDIQSWATRPYVQLALVYEQMGALRAARTSIGEALSRDRHDWRLWLISARLNTKLGAVKLALQDLRAARRLNPRSQLFVRVPG